MLECVVHILASVAACVAVTCASFFDSVVISSPKCVKGQKNWYCDGVTLSVTCLQQVAISAC